MAAGGDGPSEPKILSVQRESLGEGRPKIVPEGRGREFQKLVSCGSAAHETDLVIVDPETCQSVAQQVVGEIWIRGSSISNGYWNRDEENQALFHAALSDGRTGFCRTGDLGFIHEGQLYVTGRLKDVVILRGRNLFPQDIETTVRETVGSDGGQCAAFAVQSPRGEALAIIAELPRRADESTLPELVRQIRRSVIDIHEVDPRHVLLVRQAAVPLTSSGKVQRSRCREIFDRDEFKTKFRYDRSSASEQSTIPIPELPATPTQDDRDSMTIATESWMSQWLVSRAGVDPAEVDLEKPFADYGLDSMTAVEMSGEIEDWSGVELTPIVAWNYPTVAKLSEFLVSQLLDDAAHEPTTQNDQNENLLDPDSHPPNDADVSEADLEDLLDEIELLSDDEIDHALADKPLTDESLVDKKSS